MGSKFRDLTNKVFGRLKVIRQLSDYVSPKGQRGSVWEAVCDCGKIKSYRGSDLFSNRVLSCGCFKAERISETHKGKVIDLTGKRFGMLLVIDLAHIHNHYGSVWNCKCDCGNTRKIKGIFLRRANGTKSCGCTSESKIAKELKRYCETKYNAIREYKIFRNPITNYYLPFDIYIPDRKIFIEINGSQHYNQYSFYDRDAEEFEYRKKLDRMKRKYARQNGIYIELDLRKIKTIEQAILYLEDRIK